MTHPYASLLTELPDIVEDPRYPYQYLTERHVQALWYEQKYFKNLKTEAGEDIQVISPGIWNAEAGPDFLHAHFVVGGQELKGAIEIHLSDDQWYQHRHHEDSRYDQVVLHVSLWEPKKQQLLFTRIGKNILKTHLEKVMTISHPRILKLIDLDLYPYKKFVGSGRCAQELFCHLPEEKISAFFQSAADWRLLQKGKTDIPTGIAQALGYKHNAETFRQLFLYLIKFRDEDFSTLLARAMTICGFFESNRWDNSYYLQLKEKAPKEALRLPLVLHQIRPLNHPLRRLVYLVKFIQDPAMMTLYHRLLDWKKQPLASLVPIYEHPYWNTHFNFETEASPIFLPLMGQNTIQEICVNVFLPVIYKQVTKSGDLEEIKAFQKLYRSFPSTKKGKTRYLQHRFFGDTPKGTVLNKAIHEQGAYQLHRDFCSHYEASCEGCPFVKRFTEKFETG